VDFLAGCQVYGSILLLEDRKEDEWTLEAHANRFHYSTMRQEETPDMIYWNMKHALFQPAEKEMIMLIHFRLHDWDKEDA
jgi:nucleosome binding factor SPN SPT16 subunit